MRANRRPLDRLQREGTGMTGLVNLLEVCGILSFNLTAAQYVHFTQRFGVTVVPGSAYDTRLPDATAGDLLATMEKRMALKDAEIALAVAQYAGSVSAFLSWHASISRGSFARRRSLRRSGCIAARGGPLDKSPHETHRQTPAG